MKVAITPLLDAHTHIPLRARTKRQRHAQAHRETQTSAHAQVIQLLYRLLY